VGEGWGGSVGGGVPRIWRHAAPGRPAEGSGDDAHQHAVGGGGGRVGGQQRRGGGGGALVIGAGTA
jgi:hypothetical protein